jgi:glyoxylase-like metal-dependent hydrolase (beta-lactamase superfamily II)
MNEILPGVFHWRTFFPKIGQDVHSHYWAEGKALMDPLLPEDSEPVLAELRERGVDVIVLSNRHHWRSASEVQKAFPEVTVLCNDQGLYEFTDDDERWVEPYAYGALVAPGLKALEFGAICDDDAALLMDTKGGALLFADGLIVWDGELSFVPDFLLGDDPEAVKDKLRSGLKRLLAEAEFDNLLFAHGDPWIGGGRAALRDFVASGGRSAGFSD